MTKVEFTQLLSSVYRSPEIDYFWRCIQEDVPNITTDFYRSTIERLLAHEPIDYITGWTYFLDYKLKVDKHVLIPRPETEELVMQVIEDYRGVESLSILDIGTGSGCIAISLCKKLRNSVITAIDIDDNALSIAKSNAERFNCEIDFRKLDFLTNAESLGKYDIIISNPPYIAVDIENNRLSPSTLSYEPGLALFGPKHDHLQFYKDIATFGLNHLKQNGKIYLELNPFDANEIASYYRDYKSIVLIQDIHGKDRILKLSS